MFALDIADVIVEIFAPQLLQNLGLTPLAIGSVDSHSGHWSCIELLFHIQTIIYPNGIMAQMSQTF